MLKYIYTLATLLDSKSRSRKHYSPDVVLSDLLDTDLDEIDFVMSLSELELIYGFEIPNKLFDRTNITIGEYAYELSQLPLIPDNLYEEFYDIKMESMRLTKRYIQLEIKIDEESLREKNEINQEFELLTDRLNVLLGNILVN
ncbi:MAG: hypothetical protein IPJ23_11510 [Ignavibacteriales bacterium]|nr:hypothetical protein [Ignavibacteriales bacterium]